MDPVNELKGGEEKDQKVIDDKLAVLNGKKQAWGQLKLSEKVDILKECLISYKKIQHQWAKQVCIRKGFDPDTWDARPEYASELVTQTMIVTNLLKRYISSLEALDKTGATTAVTDTKTTQDGSQSVVRVFPITDNDKQVFKGVEAEIYIQPGKPASQGENFKAKHKGPTGICAVMGANNQTILGFADSLDQLIRHNNLVFLKHSSVFDNCADALDGFLEPLISRGYVQTACCDIPAASYLLHHDLVDHVHFTGGIATYNAIVWGRSEHEQEQNKANNTPVLKKPITSELGAVSPWIITPGEWTEQEVKHYASALASGVYNNNSCNCLAPKVIIMQQGWEHANAFIDAFKSALSKTPSSPPYYPGIQGRQQRFIDAYPEHEELAHSHKLSGKHDTFGEHLKQIIIDGIQLDQKSFACANEPFAPVTSFAYIEAKNVSDFLNQAVKVCNETLQGDLSCSLIHSYNGGEKFKAEIQSAIDKLEYGSIGVNVWAAFGFLLETCTWGGFPGGTIAEPSSGVGVVHNALFIDHPQKSVVRQTLPVSQQDTTFSLGGDRQQKADKSLAINDLLQDPGVCNLTRLLWAMTPRNARRVVKAAAFAGIAWAGKILMDKYGQSSDANRSQQK